MYIKISLLFDYNNCRLARRDSQTSLLVASQDSQGMSVPIAAVNDTEDSTSGDEVSVRSSTKHFTSSSIPLYAGISYHSIFG